jgi:pyruvate dehydrogenase phosphatase
LVTPKKRSLPDDWPTLNAEQIDLVLTQNQTLLLPKTPTSLVKHAHFNTVASNHPIEDYHVESIILPNGTLFGLFDGHSGTECAQKVSENISAYFLKELKKISIQNKNERMKQVESALSSAFTQLDSDLLKGGLSSQSSFWFFPKKLEPYSIMKELRPAMAGSCALVAYLEGNQLYIACTGDSRAVLGRKRSDGGYYALELSADQTTKNPAEYARLLEEHPGEDRTVVQRGRVLGGLMPTRAFGLFFLFFLKKKVFFIIFLFNKNIGDARYKWPKETMDILSRFGGKRPLPNYITPPYVTAQPVVTTLTLDPSRDSFVILATDGLWDELTSDEAVQIVAKNQEKHTATALIEQALSGGDPNRLGQILGIPAPKSRRYRDDMTVNVLFLSTDSPETFKKQPLPITENKTKISYIDGIQPSLTQSSKPDHLSSWLQILKNWPLSKL